MANLNLSEFTEKLFVADSDHTFIWDTAASISKRVSRNSWLNSGTLTSDAPVTISQTWGTTGTYTAVKVVATETLGANANSNLLELWAGNAATLKLFVKKNGDFAIRDQGQIGTPNFLLGSGSGSGIYFAGGDLRLYVDPVSAKFVMSNAQTAIKIGANYSFGWSNGADAALTADTILVRDSASGNTLALRNGTSAQTFNVYGTYTSGTSYERLTLSAPSAANAIIGTNKGSGGGTARGLDLHTDGSARMTITTAGNVGIGTTSPTSKLQVTNGDVEIETVTSGIIMKAAGTANRYRITLNAGGTDFVITAL